MTASIRLAKNSRYYPAALVVYCWVNSEGGLADSQGLYCGDYFDADCYYRGPDENGIEPVFTEESALVSEVALILAEAGERFAGNNVIESARDWYDHDFDASEVSDWCGIGCWNPSVAAQWRDAGLAPEIVTTAAEVLLLSIPDDADPCGTYADGCPIYSCCNDDTDPEVIIACCREVMREFSTNPSRYRAEFTGRHLGAIGVMESHSVIVEGCDEDDARNKIAEKYQDIRGLVLIPVC